MKKVIALVLLLSSISVPAFAASGPKGQHLFASATRNLSDGQQITVSGKGYSKKVGIYVTFCVIPPKGTRPSECGPFDMSGVNNNSVWISSNPPIYAALLVKPFGKGGSFSISMKVTRFIGKYDCKVVRCAVVTRADHTRPDYRLADVFIPVTFK